MATMGEKLDKFLLLMWKNWVLQYRRPIQTLVEIMAPLLFSVLLVIIRSLADPTYEHERIYQPFCTIPTQFTDIINQNLSIDFCPNPDAATVNNIFDPAGNSSFNFTILYTPPSADFNRTMSFFNIFPDNIVVQGVESVEEMEKLALKEDSTNIGFEFKGDFTNLEVAIRFPAEITYKSDSTGITDWRTGLTYPVFQSAGPRSPDSAIGSVPNYSAEGFLMIQHYVTLALILAQSGYSYPNDIGAAVQYLVDGSIPVIEMKRFPYAAWYSDVLLTALSAMLGMIVMLSFVYTCINTVKSITTEKEKQLKESMKIMGLPNWLHWLAWFVKCFIFLLISVTLMVVLLKVKWYTHTDYTVFTYADPFVLFVFMMLYACSTICFCFALSVFFSKANTAATMAGLAWFISYTPYLFMQNNYSTLSLSTKLLSSLLTNTGMAFGFQVILMYEGTGDGVQWSNLFTPNTPDDTLSLGLIWIMLIVNSLLYLFIAIYVEAVFPGEYGVPQKWYFLFTKKYWCGASKSAAHAYETEPKDSELFEVEPTNLEAGIQIYNLRKRFGTKVAVRNLSLNMYENQITVLLGHNGAGKTTTMSMLTGMITPTSGTAVINKNDIRTNMLQVRNSLGLCPQHNIIFDDLTVSEHFYFFSKLKGLSRKEIKNEIDKYVKLLDLEPKRNAKSSTLSGGMKRKLCVGVALCGNSKVVLLDEPTAGMDPSARRTLWEFLQKQKEGRTILLSTHFMDEADLLGDRIAIMAGGELQCSGSSFFLKKKYGAGYSLIMDKAKHCNPHNVTELLKKFIPNLEIHSNVGSELTYLLAENHSAVFEAMLKQLEHESDQLGIQSYGISLTTLEEVFLKVGADHGQEEEYNEKDNEKNQKKQKSQITNYDTGPVSLAPTYFSGFNLAKNQFLALLLKKVVSTWRSWILLVIQLLLPVVNIIIVMSVPNSNKGNTLPALPLNFDKFSSPVTLMETSDGMPFASNYTTILSRYGLSATNTDINALMLDMTASNPNTIRRHYIVGASFENTNIIVPNSASPLPNITAWFNNDPFHSPGIALGLVLSTVYYTFSDGGSLEFSNKPFPYKAKTQINNIMSGQTQGFQFAFNIGFSLAFVSAFYVIFLVRENVSKSKHLQFVSGVKVYIFWLVHILCDTATFLVNIILLLITIVCFQQDGFKTGGDIGRLFVILFCFGYSFMPLYYLSAMLFSVPSTGYTRMTLIGIFIGSGAFLVVQVLNTPGLNLEYVGKALHWVFLIFPHYSLSTAINECYTVYSYIKVCDQITASCAQMGIYDKDECIANFGTSISNICTDLNDNYFSWQSPGMGRCLVFLLVSGFVWCVILLIIEYKLLSRFIYWTNQKFFPKYPIDIQDEDHDVANEKERIRNSAEFQLTETNTLVVRDLTKYYKNFLAVNGLSLGIDKLECFGLLGVNGAGKTTTFKMMSGDESISYGDAWVKGRSVKTELKQVQRFIGYCPQFDALLDDMTAKETIMMYCLLRGIELRNTEKVAVFLSRQFDFHRHLEKKVKEMSGGNKRKLSTVLSLIGDPPVIFLDEPTTGMDPGTKRYLWDALCKIRDSGKCIVLTSHSMEECEALCTRIAIMVNGNFKCLGSTQHLKNKFAEGYTLTIKVKKLPDSSGLNHTETGPIEQFIKEKFPGAQLREKHQELLNYYITDKSLAWSTMFGILEKGKRSNLNIEDYSLGQSSLEQVFLTFTKYQNPEAEG